VRDIGGWFIVRAVITVPTINTAGGWDDGCEGERSRRGGGMLALDATVRTG
jgi:hypothetical protein